MSQLNIYQRLIEVQKKVLSVQKNETVKMYENDKGYKAVTHDDVAAALHLPLAEAGIVLLPNVISYTATEFDVTKAKNGQSYVQKWYRTDIEVNVQWVNADNPDDRVGSTGHAFALDTSDKSYAKAYSLALKVILLKFHLLESRDGEESREFEKDQARQQAVNKNTNRGIVHSKDFVMPIGQVKGKKLGDLTAEQLIGIRKWTRSQFKLNPKPQNISQISDIHNHVKKLMGERSIEMPPEEPENPFEQFAETEEKPPIENKAPDDDIGDYVIKLNTIPEIEGLRGQKLKSIPDDILADVVKILDAEMQKIPKAPNIADVFSVSAKVKSYLNREVK